LERFITIADRRQFRSGTVRRFEIEGQAIAVVRLGDRFFAFQDRCTHEEVPLSDGFIEGEALCCAMHGAKFDLETGAALSPPAHEDAKTFRIRCRDGRIQVEIDGSRGAVS